MSGRTKRRESTNQEDASSLSGVSGSATNATMSNFTRMCALPEPTVDELEYMSFLEKQEGVAAMSSEEPGLSQPDAFETSSQREVREARIRQEQQEDWYYGSETDCSYNQVAGIPFRFLTQGMTPTARRFAPLGEGAKNFANVGLVSADWGVSLVHAAFE